MQAYDDGLCPCSGEQSGVVDDDDNDEAVKITNSGNCIKTRISNDNFASPFVDVVAMPYTKYPECGRFTINNFHSLPKNT